MKRCATIAVATVMLVSFFGIGCEEPLVGAPCIPETDKGEFKPTLTGETYAVETRSVQCETSICLTKTRKIGTPSEAEEISEYERT